MTAAAWRGHGALERTSTAQPKMPAPTDPQGSTTRRVDIARHGGQVVDVVDVVDAVDVVVDISTTTTVINKDTIIRTT